MARWWLTMTKHGLYLHPFGSVITNKEAHQLMLEHFNENEVRKNPLWMLVRMGYGEKPPQAQRMPLEKMVITGKAERFFKPASKDVDSAVTPGKVA